MDRPESKCVSRAPLEGQERHPSIYATSIWIMPTPSTAWPLSPNLLHQKLLHLHLLRPNSQESSVIPPSFSHPAPHPSHPAATPLKRYPESNCVLRCPLLLTSCPGTYGASGKGMCWHSRGLGPSSLSLGFFSERKGGIQQVIWTRIILLSRFWRWEEPGSQDTSC